MKSMKKLVLASLALLAVMMVILPLVGCDTNAGSSSILNTGTTGGNTGDNGNGSDNTGNNGGNTGSDSSSGNAGGKIIVFKTAPDYFFPLTFTFNTKEGTVVVAHPIDGNKYGTYTGNLNQNGTITMIVNDDSGQTRGITTITGTISESGKKLTAELPKIGETVLIREDTSDSGNGSDNTGNNGGNTGDSGNTGSSSDTGDSGNGNSDSIVDPNDEPPYLTFKSMDGSEITVIFESGGDYKWHESIECSTDGGEWVHVDYLDHYNNLYATYTRGNTIRVRGKSPEGTSTLMVGNGGVGYKFNYGAMIPQGDIEISGDIRTLVDYENWKTVDTSNARFYRLFVGHGVYSDRRPKGKLSAEKLDLTSNTLAERCYESMFNGCTGLTSAPVLSASTLAEGCYFYMFDGCTGLTSAPELPATTLAEECYRDMFENCTGLTSAPELPATTLAKGCYYSMFYGCENLTKAPELPATTLAKDCYSYMFYGCTSLIDAPALPATTLAEGYYYYGFYGCYSYMFYGCTSLIDAPALPATTLAKGCYSYMFYGCTSLIDAPELPATTLAEGCYDSMFYGCENLTKAPELRAPILTSYCYCEMFKGCSKLSSITVLATSKVDGAYAWMNNWLEGAAKSGTVTRVRTNEPSSVVEYIPKGWNYVDYQEQTN